VTELSGGARYTFLGLAQEQSGLLPYLSGGLAGAFLSGRDSDEGALGAYARGGLTYVFGGGFTLGLDLKGLASTSDYLDYYLQLTIPVGWSF